MTYAGSRTVCCVRRESVRGRQVAVWQSGGAGRDLVFVHGFQNDHSAWAPLTDRLGEDRYRLTTFDLPGCGASDSPSTWEQCTIDEYGTDLLALCDVLALDRPVVVGHSLGAAVLLSAALASRGRFAGLVLMAPASTSGLDFLPDDAAFRALAHPSRDQQRALARAAFHLPPPDAYLEQLMVTIDRATPQHIEGAARSMRSFVRQQDLSALDVPSIVICGDRDRHVPLRNHLATRQAIRRCGLQVYFDVGHVPFVETADRCAEDVERFLATLG